MERFHAIALTKLRPAMSLTDLCDMYQMAGGATPIIENIHNLGDILPDISAEYQAEVVKSVDEALRQAAAEMEFCEKHGIKVLTQDDEEYPYRLRNCPDAPVVLYYRGTANLNAEHVLCIIGTRKCTQYGRDIINRFVTDLSKKIPDALIVSGLAYGVDINAHRSALECGLPTVGVVAHGLDTIYPNVHREDARRMVSHGGVLTEYPQRSFIDKRNFLQRNRIVAGMSDACIIPESASHGGGLVTCRISTDYGRQVFAFPGNVGAEYSAGCNNLIRDNKAQLITSADDFIFEMGWENDIKLEEARTQGIERQLFPDLSPEEKRIADTLSKHGDMLIDDLATTLQQSIPEVKATLFLLEMNGIIRQLAGGIVHLVM